MENIKGANRRNFFPNSKGTSKANQSWSMRKASLARNDGSKANELNNLTSKDAKVDISSAIKDFSRIKRAVDLAPDIDNSSKIAKLRSQIKDGSYKINYDALADKMLSTEF